MPIRHGVLCTALKRSTAPGGVHCPSAEIHRERCNLRSSWGPSRRRETCAPVPVDTQIWLGPALYIILSCQLKIKSLLSLGAWQQLVVWWPGSSSRLGFLTSVKAELGRCCRCDWLNPAGEAFGCSIPSLGGSGMAQAAGYLGNALISTRYTEGKGWCLIALLNAKKGWKFTLHNVFVIVLKEMRREKFMKQIWHTV